MLLVAVLCLMVINGLLYYKLWGLEEAAAYTIMDLHVLKCVLSTFLLLREILFFYICIICICAFSFSEIRQRLKKIGLISCNSKRVCTM